MKRALFVGVLLVVGCHHEQQPMDVYDLSGIVGDDLSGAYDGGYTIGLQYVDGGILTSSDPTSCGDALSSRSYIGCEYWPTVVANGVWNVFDFAVVVSNPSTVTAHLTISGGSLPQTKSATVMAGELVKIGLPWVQTLKGPQNAPNGVPVAPISNSVLATAGAYHLTSDVPVLVYQFNALEYKAGTGLDLNGIAWNTCPANEPPCDSFTNDASLLLPSTALTPNYIITSLPGDDVIQGGVTNAYNASYVAITGTANNTTVKMLLSTTADIIASKDGVQIPVTAQNKTSPTTVTYMINAGDVLELFSSNGSLHDLTGSQIQASAPVQVIVGNPCSANPTFDDSSAATWYTCDHVEESVLPIETWGLEYVVTSPTGPDGNQPGHTVRIYGGVTPANLKYSPPMPALPATIAPGSVFTVTTTTDFHVTGDAAFAITTEQLSGQKVDTASTKRGDPALSTFPAIEQFRDKYIFLAPTDYSISFVDVVIQRGTRIYLDNVPVDKAPVVIDAMYSVLHLQLGVGVAGAHTMTGDAPFGIQVIGYGDYTSYQYPGGLDLKVITPAPPPIQ